MIRSVCLHINDRSTQSETTKDEQEMIVRDKVRAEELARETPTQLTFTENAFILLSGNLEYFPEN